ncbi:hypothetical protein IU500_24775 [Nocardia terpenica]|uniref:hypothetical protein n=1 Tax=Nocardia terpenica TaxID=455432 RepID=UPI0018936C0D|nr:hypothetical protein [Nocardia terpenica]MBF6064717.1 hypothetical protein [Nocardia terpenica]MBF6107232.1 hypothetical protein [Nocardia terpenica]MBF6114989.1 hypothetical protein [Nocardia terpenica]MBF6122095.1 hypothetical protein [Nocardia terpenica]MBF6154478.1 hypothetical protein [Nocardia terpenica]
MGAKNSAIIARRQAREQLARERAAQAERNRANEKDLAEYLLLEQRIEATEVECATAVSTAQCRRDDAIAALRQRQGECLQRMRGRGDGEGNIADRTGLSIKDVRRIMSGRQHHRGPAPEGGVTDEQ